MCCPLEITKDSLGLIEELDLRLGHEPAQVAYRHSDVGARTGRGVKQFANQALVLRRVRERSVVTSNIFALKRGTRRLAVLHLELEQRVLDILFLTEPEGPVGPVSFNTHAEDPGDGTEVLNIESFAKFVLELADERPIRPNQYAIVNMLKNSGWILSVVFTSSQACDHPKFW